MAGIRRNQQVQESYNGFKTRGSIYRYQVPNTYLSDELTIPHLIPTWSKLRSLLSWCTDLPADLLLIPLSCPVSNIQNENSTTWGRITSTAAFPFQLLPSLLLLHECSRHLWPRALCTVLLSTRCLFSPFKGFNQVLSFRDVFPDHCIKMSSLPCLSLPICVCVCVYILFVSHH